MDKEKIVVVRTIVFARTKKWIDFLVIAYQVGDEIVGAKKKLDKISTLNEKIKDLCFLFAFHLR